MRDSTTEICVSCLLQIDTDSCIIFVIMTEEVSDIAWRPVEALSEYLPALTDVQSLVTDVALVSSDCLYRAALVSSDCLLRVAASTWVWLASIHWRYWTNTILQTARACLQTLSQTDPVYILILGRLGRRNSFICKHSTLELLSYKQIISPSNSILLNAFLFP